METRRYQLPSFFLSLFFHGLVLFLGGLILFKPPRFAVELGAATDVELVSTSPNDSVSTANPETSSKRPAENSAPPTAIRSDDFTEPVEKIKKQTLEKTQPSEKKVEVTSKKKSSSPPTNSTNAGKGSGVTTAASPDYLHNPAPYYPESARRAGEQGVVLLFLQINERGVPIQINLKRSSGSSVLDRAAFNSVADWKFKPGMVGGIPVKSEIVIPIRFRLEGH